MPQSGDSNLLREHIRGEMANKISQCNSCARLFDSKKTLKEHIDKTHRITDSKISGLKSLIVILLPITDWFSVVKLLQ